MVCFILHVLVHVPSLCTSCQLSTVVSSHSLVRELRALSDHMTSALSRVFPDDTVEEFVTTLISPKLDDVIKIVGTVHAQVALQARPKERAAASGEEGGRSPDGVCSKQE